jgi:hypothetical protein
LSDLLQYVVLILELIHVVIGVFGIPIKRMSKGASLLRSILLCWGLLVLWGLIWIVVLPLALLPFGRHVVMLFPEGHGMFAIVVLGWVPSVLVCSIGSFIIEIKNRNKTELPEKSPQTTD